MRQPQCLLVHADLDGRLLVLLGRAQPEGLAHQQVFQAVVREACGRRPVTARSGVAEPGTHQAQGDTRPATPAQVAPVSLSELQGPVVTPDN